MLCNEVEKYISAAKGLPFFYFVGDDDYTETLAELKQHGVRISRISDFCPKDDKYPDIDDIVDHFRTLDIDYTSNKHVLVGLGEYLALRGADFAAKTLTRLKDTTLGTARVILLLRSAPPQVYSLVKEDHRLNEGQRVFVSSNIFSSISICRTKYSLGKDTAKGIKGLLRNLEDGAKGTCYVTTPIEFGEAVFPVSNVGTAYDAIRQKFPKIRLSSDMGTEQQWGQLFAELEKRKTIEAIWKKYKIPGDLEEDLYQNCAGLEFCNWLFFVFLKLHIAELDNSYLRYVVGATNQYDALKDNILTEIIRIPKNDTQFGTFRSERKRLLQGFPESDLAIFIRANDVDPEESIYRLTDSTSLERKEIITWVTKYGYIKEIDTIYPALGKYLQNYVFDCGNISDMLTDYFKQYRMQKVENRIDSKFLTIVEEIAHSMPYTRLETRDSAILRIENKPSAFLYWIDALGVEYLSYITQRVREKGLAMHVDITYADLPTITSVNREFYDKWPGSLKYKEKELDEIKHKENGGFSFEKCEAPIHLDSELRIIDRAIDQAATELAMHRCKLFVIASDHGASRLAVIHRQEEKYETDTKGEHSGRCCKEFDSCDLPYAIKENGYVVLADYGRFKGSRKANVEVHGGASLEEVVVPVITLRLKKSFDTEVKLLKPESIIADRTNGATIRLYISDLENGKCVSVLIGDKRYDAVREDQTHYTVRLTDIRRSRKNISAGVYDGDDLIGNVVFDIKGKIATTNDDFEDLL